MDYEQKLYALNSLGECKILMRKPGDWYVSQSTEVKNNGMLEGRYGNGCTPQEAIVNHWERLTELAEHEYIIIHAGREDRKAVKWNGFMWEAVKE